MLKVLAGLGVVAGLVWWAAALVKPAGDERLQATAQPLAPPEAKAVATETDAAELAGRSLKQSETEGAVITDFSTAAEAERWRAVNDGVMGGVSQGSFRLTATQTGMFSGTISLENNGGFSSVRRASDDYDFSGVGAIALRIKGDGRRYQFRLKTEDTNNSISYRAQFNTQAGEWTTVEIPLSSFEPVFRGRVIRDAPALVPTEIQQIGFLLADKAPGTFSLEVDWIRSRRRF